MKNKKEIFFLLFILFLQSCESEINYFPLKNNAVLSYEIEKIDDEGKTLNKQIYNVINKYKNQTLIIGNGGQLIKYITKKEGVVRKEINYLKNEYITNFDDKLKRHKSFGYSEDKLDLQEGHYVLKFPLKKGKEWIINDLTRLKMKVGYDKVFETWIPFNMKKKIASNKETVKIKNKIFKNCIKVVGKGNTSYNVGPPIGVVNITINSTDWYAPNVGLIKTIRNEKSDSEIMGEITIQKVYE